MKIPEDVALVIAAGDALMAEGKAAEALEHYRAAEALEPDLPALYGKLIEAHKAATGEWTEEDFALTLSWEMRKQELEHPAMRAAHERLTPEWNEVTELLRRLLVTEDPALLKGLGDQIVVFEGRAVRPLLDFILMLKDATVQPVDAADQDDR